MKLIKNKKYINIILIRGYIIAEVLISLILISTLIITITYLIAESSVRIKDNHFQTFSTKIVTSLFEKIKNGNLQDLVDNLDVNQLDQTTYKVVLQQALNTNTYNYASIKLYKINEISSNYNEELCLQNVPLHNQFKIDVSQFGFGTRDICIFIKFERLNQISNYTYVVDIISGAKIKNSTIKNNLKVYTNI